jgi:hypothetical protein
MDASRVAELLNEFRVAPRILITMYGVVFYDVAQWFMVLDNPTAAQAAFVSTMVGAAAAFFGLYVRK